MLLSLEPSRVRTMPSERVEAARDKSRSTSTTSCDSSPRAFNVSSDMRRKSELSVDVGLEGLCGEANKGTHDRARQWRCRPRRTTPKKFRISCALTPFRQADRQAVAILKCDVATNDDALEELALYKAAACRFSSTVAACA